MAKSAALKSAAMKSDSKASASMKAKKVGAMKKKTSAMKKVVKGMKKVTKGMKKVVKGMKKKPSAMKKAMKGMKKATKTMKSKAMKSKAMKKSTVGKKFSVFKGTKKRTGGNLKKEDLKMNKFGKIVSKKGSERSRKSEGWKKLQKWGAAFSEARKRLKITGFVPCGGSSEQGKKLLAKTKVFYQRPELMKAKKN